ncbi:SAM50 [Auxenochlorella protothecoides x Auxenochlorella symbiontica]
MEEFPSSSGSEEGFVPDYDFESSFERLKDSACFPARLTILGLKRTNKHLVMRELLRVKNAQTLDEIKDAVVAAYQDLMALEIFDAVDIVIDGLDGKHPEACSITARFSEKSPIQVHTGTYVQGQEGSVEASATLTNPLGHAERLNLSGEWGSRSTTTYSLALTRARPRGLPYLATARLYQQFSSFERWSSFTELLRGAETSLSTEDGRHLVGAGIGWYRLADPARRASRSVQQQFGEGVRSAIKYTFRHTTFSGEASFPLEGYGVSATSEVGTHSGGPARGPFFKQRCAAQVALPLGPAASLTLAGEAGLLLPLRPAPAATPSPITDRFFLGGLSGASLRGFSQRGVGPSDVRRPPPAAGVGAAAPPAAPAAPGGRTRDALGGDVFCTFLGALNFELPFEATRAAGLYAHLFVNGGNVVGLGPACREDAAAFASGFRWSMGAGIVWPTRVGKLELNLTRVVRAREHDRVKTGVQFGFSPPAF